MSCKHEILECRVNIAKREGQGLLIPEWEASASPLCVFWKSSSNTATGSAFPGTVTKPSLRKWNSACEASAVLSETIAVVPKDCNDGNGQFESTHRFLLEKTLFSQTHSFVVQ